MKDEICRSKKINVRTLKAADLHVLGAQSFIVSHFTQSQPWGEKSRGGRYIPIREYAAYDGSRNLLFSRLQ